MRRAPADSRIVIVNWRDRTHPSAGAAEIYCERLARELAGRGRSVVLLTSRPPSTAAREERDGYQVRRLGGRWSVYPLALLWLLVHRRVTGAVIDSQNGIPFFSPLVVASGVPVVLLIHHVHQDLFSTALPAAAARLARWLEGPASRRVYRGRTVVVRSPSARTQVRRRLRFDGPLRVVPCGADTLGMPGRRSSTPRVVVVGRLTPDKRIESLITAMGEVGDTMPGAQLHLVGDGPARQALEEQARAAGVAVVFHGRLPDAGRDAVLSTAWLTVSASDAGDWAVSLVEANAAGVPVLALRRSGAGDVVRHGQTGWLVDGSAERLGASVTRALTTLADPATAAAIAEGARAYAARFTWSRTGEGLLQALESERLRLQRSNGGARERRTGNDIVVALSVAESLLSERARSVRRAGDLWLSDGTTARGLLTGADEGDVPAILERLGVDREDPSVSVLVARHADLLDGRRLLGDRVIDLMETTGARPVRATGPGGRHAA